MEGYVTRDSALLHTVAHRHHGCRLSLVMKKYYCSTRTSEMRQDKTTKPLWIVSRIMP